MKADIMILLFKALINVNSSKTAVHNLFCSTYSLPFISRYELKILCEIFY